MSAAAPDLPELTARERAALVTYLLWVRRERLTTADVARLTGLRRRGAHELMAAISRVLPLRQGRDGVWRPCD